MRARLNTPGRFLSGAVPVGYRAVLRRPFCYRRVPEGPERAEGVGQESAYLASATAFGPGPGTYESIAYYQSALGEWYAAPAGTAGTKGTTTLDLA